MAALDDAAGKELVSMVRELFGASLAIQGVTIVLKNARENADPISIVTIPTSSQSSPGVMAASDKVKLDGVEEEANKTVVDQELSDSSQNPVQNRAVKEALDEKAQADHTHAAIQITGLAFSRALASDAGGHPVATSVTSDELECLSGVAGPVQMQLDAKASTSSPAFRGVPTAPTATLGANTTQIATCAFVQEAIMGKMEGVAMYRGAVSSESEIASSQYQAGWYWVVSEAGSFFGRDCESGDMIFANSARSGAGSDSDFDIIQTNISYVMPAEVRGWFA